MYKAGRDNSSYDAAVTGTSSAHRRPRYTIGCRCLFNRYDEFGSGLPESEAEAYFE